MAKYLFYVIVATDSRHLGCHFCAIRPPPLPLNASGTPVLAGKEHNAITTKPLLFCVELFYCQG